MRYCHSSKEKGRSTLLTKSILIVFTALVAGAAFAAEEPVPCDVQDSVLCIGLVSHYEMEEGSNEHRIDEVSGLPSLLERNGANIGQAAGFVDDNPTEDDYAAHFTAIGTEDGLHIPYGGPAFSGIGPWTVAMWVRFDTVSAAMHVFNCTTDTSLGIYGPSLYFEDANDRLVFQITSAAGGTYQQHSVATANSSITADTWYLVAVGLEPIADPTTNDLVKMWISLTAESAGSAGTKTTTNVDYPAVALLQDFVLGANNLGTEELDGRIDTLSIWGRTLNDDDLDELFSSGNGDLTYPFQ